ncbi:unnamed protein product [Litomosoides sigmodontis]|uniref:SH3 domain-containing protein n=1 Tax=Litomosoides sigmodontis TaxID=42156 RepID=A0A3P6UA37_LITSI|nr:unnamed protein product [Litomosoides sigmodontis]
MDGKKGDTGTFATGKFSAAFNTAKTVFDSVKKPAIQHKLIAASKNETVRSAVSSLAKNEAARKATLNTLRDERTLKTAYHIAQACDRQNQKNFANLVDGVSTLALVDDAATSKYNANKVVQLMHPSLPPSRDCASYAQSDPKTADNFKIRPDQPVAHNISQFNFASETDAFTINTNQEEQPHGYARFKFIASHFDELSAEPLDMIILERKVDDQWVYGLNRRTGHKGIIPFLYIDIKIPLPATQSSSDTEVPFYATALFDFDSNMAGDLKFQVHDEIYVTEKINNDWLRGMIGTRQGIFPANYVQKITAPAAPTSEPISCHESVKYIHALYDYNSAVEGDLIFRAGDRIEVLEWVSGDWLRGKLNGKIGLVPRTYIEGCSRNIDSAKQLNAMSTVLTATKDYHSTSADYLCFSKGDQIEVIEEIDGNWLKGKLLLNMSNTKSFPIGLFPRSAVL